MITMEKPKISREKLLRKLYRIKINLHLSYIVPFTSIIMILMFSSAMRDNTNEFGAITIILLLGFLFSYFIFNMTSHILINRIIRLNLNDRLDEKLRGIRTIIIVSYFIAALVLTWVSIYKINNVIERVEEKT